VGSLARVRRAGGIPWGPEDEGLEDEGLEVGASPDASEIRESICSDGSTSIWCVPYFDIPPTVCKFCDRACLCDCSDRETCLVRSHVTEFFRDMGHELTYYRWVAGKKLREETEEMRVGMEMLKRKVRRVVRKMMGAKEGRHLATGGMRK
jgi:hypothetical protein